MTTKPTSFTAAHGGLLEGCLPQMQMIQMFPVVFA